MKRASLPLQAKPGPPMTLGNMRELGVRGLRTPNITLPLPVSTEIP